MKTFLICLGIFYLLCVIFMIIEFKKAPLIPPDEEF